MAKQQTTSSQWDIMLEHMTQNVELARGDPMFGSNRKEVEESFQELAKKANAVGPPKRDWKEWRKVWFDLKTRTKKIISENKLKAAGTGGGINTQIPLTHIEQAADSILCLSTAANPPGEVFGLETAGQFSNVALDDAVFHERNEILQMIAGSVEQPQKHEPQKRKTPTDLTPNKCQKGFEYESLQVLKEQANTQKEMLITLKDLTETQKRIANAMQVLAEWTK